MTEIIATFKINKIISTGNSETIKEMLMTIAEDYNMDLISWGTI